MGGKELAEKTTRLFRSMAEPQITALLKTYAPAPQDRSFP